MKNKRIAVLSPVAWRTPPRHYGAWETVAGNITEGLIDRGWDVTLFATADSITKAKLHWFMALTYTALVKTPVLTTIHGFSSQRIMPVYYKYRNGYFVSISFADRAEGINYLDTVYNGINLACHKFFEKGGEYLSLTPMRFCT